MNINLCKVFGVEEGEEFEFNKYKGKRYKVINGRLELLTNIGWVNSAFRFNQAIGCEVIKLPKRKEFTDDELAVFRCMDKKYKWAIRDRRYGLTVFENKPKKITNNKEEYWKTSGDWLYLGCFENMFQAITTKDEEPVFIDDYVER